MTPKEWTLLVIAAGGGKPLQPVQLQKSLFLLERNLSRAKLRVRTFYHFAPYDYGPFCGDVYSDADELCIEGLVHIDRPIALSYRQYLATEQGRGKSEKLRATLTEDVTSYLDDVVGWATTLSFRQLVSAVYRAFPDMKANSVFKE